MDPNQINQRRRSRIWQVILETIEGITFSKAYEKNEFDVSRGTVRAEFGILLACSIAKLEEKPSTRKKRTNFKLKNMNETY